MAARSHIVFALCCLARIGPGLFAADSFTCLSCTYTTSGDPSVTYECVNNSQSLPASVPCNNRPCFTRAVYTKDYKTVRSVSRGCLQQTESCDGTNCCNNYGPYPTCEYKCQSDYCNNDNPENRLRTGGATDDGSGANQAIYSKTLLFMTFLLYFVHTY